MITIIVAIVSSLRFINTVSQLQLGPVVMYGLSGIAVLFTYGFQVGRVSLMMQLFHSLVENLPAIATQPCEESGTLKKKPNRVTVDSLLKAMANVLTVHDVCSWIWDGNGLDSVLLSAFADGKEWEAIEIA
jgi:hypothetical protein